MYGDPRDKITLGGGGGGGSTGKGNSREALVSITSCFLKGDKEILLKMNFELISWRHSLRDEEGTLSRNDASALLKILEEGGMDLQALGIN